VSDATFNVNNQAMMNTHKIPVPPAPTKGRHHSSSPSMDGAS
jgi:hypothetical protein